ncbi:uncharacterized protein SETTUDRAFT_110809 [Exserohilum turcica Et28A]|uniref:Uncharacterized protein n=1 Tax=Exserohilum turcicum (strain 28A) TaxID=671987 RepID=R0KCB3_EXST2|nr:uncharacterized protein SETTUDRAFT_110809 [Exserohilum turcica Et28A]EOA85857.1 hypothetical protein SETTUDRAFT_110809 [Exserohilum turcica Et28A]
MKITAIITAALTASLTLASPAAVSLARSVKEIRNDDGTVTALSCIECPCDGFVGTCKCIPNGCCCKRRSN